MMSPLPGVSACCILMLFAFGHASSHGKEVVDANPISTSWRDRDSQALPIGLDSLQSWSTWSSWSQCSQTCGGHVIRSRTCSGVWDPVEGDKSLCPGARMQYKSCRPCTTDWSTCSTTCGGGLQHRLVAGENVTELCNTEQCPHWHSWGRWSRCSATCGASVRYRKRACSRPGKRVCAGSAFHVETCHRANCAHYGDDRNNNSTVKQTVWSTWSPCSANSTVKAGFTFRARKCRSRSPCTASRMEYKRCYWPFQWSEWSACSLSCGIGIRQRRLICYGLLSIQECPSSPEVAEDKCNTQKCPTHGSWSVWSSWTKCSKSCGVTGFQERKRSCTNPPPDPLGNDCVGRSQEIQTCHPPKCPIHGGFGNWSSPTECTASCGGGMFVQLRMCDTPIPQYGGLDCVGLRARILPCNTHHCPVDGGFSNWGDWSSCSKSCGGGSMKRYRTCTSPRPQYGGLNCTGNFSERVTCNTLSCPINGGYGNWSDLSECSKTCGAGLAYRNRSCNQPAPQYGGLDCVGPDTESFNCSVVECPIHGGYGEWSSWNPCSKLCGPGVQNRTRKCNNPAPQYNGLGCGIHGPRIENRTCQVKPCPINGQWGTWSEWSNCSEWCGVGYQERFRDCNDPSPMHGGLPCPGSNTGNRSCFERPCPIDGGYGQWTNWSHCSTTCGPGEQLRTRECNRPVPKHGGKDCAGDTNSTQTCNLRPCPINGNYSTWTEWSSCTATCGEATRNRRRDCDSPRPQFGGKNCLMHGPPMATEHCTVPPCPVDGNYSLWTTWSSCTATCGQATRSRRRDCSSPKPQFGGNNCLLIGPSAATEPCNLSPCPIDGMWAAWQTWSPCSTTCGGLGTRSRERTCTNPAPQYSGMGCNGSAMEAEACNGTHAIHLCPQDGNWSPWADWGACSVSCSDGTQVRARLCDNPPALRGGKPCAGPPSDRQACNEGPCPIDGMFSNWFTWSPCTTSCGNGTRTRNRLCNNPHPQYGGVNCSDPWTMTEACFVRPCPIDGAFGKWSDWNSCSVSCGSGVQRRFRLCNSPPPQYGGAPCNNKTSGARICNDRPCPIDGKFSDWTPWQTCSATCGSGQQQRFRACSQPKPQYGGQNCTGESLQTQRCNDRPCPVDGMFGQWTPWLACSAMCGTGRQHRNRACDSPRPEYGGKPCIGHANESKECFLRHCPIDGSVSEWTVWSSCDKTCGNGTRQRQRNCDSPKPQYGGRDCSNHLQESETCFLKHCPIDGKFSVWSPWQACSLTCGNGSQTRSRTCDNPRPQHDGRECDGSAMNMRPCYVRSCAIHGGWSEWSDWGPCLKSCGPSVQHRSRSCDSPRPQYGGSNCTGQDILIRSCFLAPCPIDGQWTAWSSWLPCSATCGRGTRSRSRTCTDPPPLFFGKDCIGTSGDMEFCQDQPCAIDGGYSEWGSWSQCSRSCGIGQRRRTRTCTAPEPQFGGRSCDHIGAALDEETCNSHPCPVDGVWLPWSRWSPCPVTCGGGLQQRRRQCQGPFFNGLPCPGDATESSSCAKQNCPDGCATKVCYPGVACRTTPGVSHIGMCGSCPVGYTGDGETCTNINECYQLPCHDISLCRDTIGGFTCLSCDKSLLGNIIGPGRTGRGIEEAKDATLRQRCLDVDECQDGSHECFKGCKNTEGGYTCDPCPRGYKGLNGRNCVVEDACEANLHSCDVESNFCVPRGGLEFDCECVDIGYLEYGPYCFRDEDLDRFPNKANSSCRGVSDWRCRTDNCPQVPNPGQEDLDGDGLGDACDVDSDNDGIPDQEDNCHSLANPHQRDRDEDGVGDLCDNCPEHHNPDQADLFPGGRGNACDRDPDRDGYQSLPVATDNCWLVVNRYQEDQDRDGHGDHCDNCVFHANPDQADRDQDGIGDVCDTGNDRDRDGIPDDRDPCPCSPDANRLTHDVYAAIRDRVYDACDADDDNDGVPDTSDNCVLVENPDQTPSRRVPGVGAACDTDYDGDGQVDAEDVCPYNNRIQVTGFRIYRTITLESSGDPNAIPNWELLQLRELEVTSRSDPSVTVSRFTFNNVTFSFDAFVNTIGGQGFIGMVFSYQSTRQFYVALWKQSTEHRLFNGRLVQASAGIVIKRISASSYGYIQEALWSDRDVIVGRERVSQTLWRDPHLDRGWVHRQTYRWEIQHRAVEGIMRLTVYEGARKLVDSGELVLDRNFRRRLHGGHVGMFAYDQEFVRFTRLSYQCDDSHPSDLSHAIRPCNIRRG